MRARRLWLGMVVTALATQAAPARSGVLPDVIAAAGGTAAIRGGSGSAGTSFSLTLQWPVADRVHFGLTGILDDLGDRTGRLRDSQGNDLGPVSVMHQAARGAAWRLEAETPRRGAYGGFAMASWGIYRTSDDLRGTLIRRSNIPTVGVGIGATRAVGARNAIGLAVRYQQLWRSTIQRYVVADVEWRWRRGSGG